MPPKKTSYPKQDIKVLLLEGISPSAVEIFRAAGYSNIVAHAKALPEDEPVSYTHLTLPTSDLV